MLGGVKQLFCWFGIMNGGIVCCVAVVVVSGEVLVGILNGTACTLDVLLAELALLTDEDGFEFEFGGWISGLPDELACCC